MARRSNPKPPAAPVELTIESLSHDGRGIARRNGKLLFVDNGLPGERLLARIEARHSRYDEAVAETIVEAVEQRRVPACPHTARCGGCSLQHFDSEAQIIWKQQVLGEQLRHFGKLEPEQWLPPLTGPVVGYRRRARLSVRFVHKRGQLMLGFRERNSHFVTEIDHCLVLDPRIDQRLPALAALLEQLDGRTEIPQVEVACGDERVALVVRHLQPLGQADSARLADFARQEDFDLYLQPGGIDRLIKLWPQDAEQWLSYALPDFALELRFHPLDFVQVNPIINRAMVRQAMELLAPTADDRLLDLFCGLGNFTLPLAQAAQSVVGVEGSPTLVARGRQNALLNGIDNAAFHAANLDEAAWRQAPWAQQKFTQVLIDPPRSGAEAVVSEISRLGIRRLLYVSCNPATLARDAGVLKQQGYRLTHAGVMDMFPHTRHVESMALFVHG
ncbi:MAG TPA: 23S rRNA (uracil(1939)-C(5))-methyltransferase RlmD [Pseudomonadales bacterium]|nr:23S rRNA (uracil(1939)-C(5))-methyltransferase RlmD [Pseudomonadales bacterium]HMW84301.1 23S rRNA (uracil(1939)-C(5))-methyltransferase RlmD [Pseudomonadales bacterium]HMY97971.1 23S rRNA (uracil(1939)-C(5))-methyltransferase RlmD [Pseudomonadales bacterium]HMZ72013.1 23S rRNA (uracil(1939)-C(5))-methyltransferase RlmD [Pseudomonadales bacterium]HMZ92790.1 23S rRNA (uracil(1939)-C(5))-methyltransferase RlmD [Pseudomonadales bacterium]